MWQLKAFLVLQCVISQTNRFDRFRRIAVEIRATVKDDRGQVVLGRDSV